MTHRLIQTEDGSCTIYVPELDEHYHSIHGAIQESRHIFIQAGLIHYLSHPPQSFSATSPLNILEAGFGTGLNAYLTLLESERLGIPINYHSLEKYPLTTPEITVLDYPEQLGQTDRSLFQKLHHTPWNTASRITPFFQLRKYHQDFREITFRETFDLVYFDAFNPKVQPHLWTPEVLERFAQALKAGGILVTYCVKGSVKQALRASGMTLRRLPGPPGKREMLRATKQA